jgi:S1-C subfamily serine protease
MNTLKRSVKVLPILGLLISGCAFRQSESTRAASFRPHADGKLGEVEIETYLQSRVAMLISSGQNPTNLWAAGEMRVPGGGNLGCAVAIDGRGYFLTAAHCLKHEFVYLLLNEAQTTWALRARVVWQGNRRKGQPDLAVLHVRRPLKHTFDWADEIRVDESAMAVGLSWAKKELRGFTLLGGKVLGCRESVGEEGRRLIANDVPLQSGDSGGPLVDAEGRLIGINTEATPPFVHWLLPSQVLPMVAERPNPKWLGELIQDDVVRQKTGLARTLQ